MATTLEELGEHLLAEKDEILRAWRARCEQDDELDLVSRLSRVQFEDNLPSAIDGLGKVFQGDEGRLQETLVEVAKHGHHRWKQGFNLQQLIRDWGHFNGVILQRVDGFFEQIHPGEVELRRAALRRLSDYLTEVISESVRRFDELRRSEAAALAADLKTTRTEFEKVTAARGQMLREFAHDLRGGLSAVSGASTLLRNDAAEESILDLVEILDEGVGTVRKMLESLLDLSRLESGAEELQLATVDVSKPLEDLGREMRPKAEEHGLRLNVYGPPSLLVPTDPQKIRRIAQNLLVNAIEYTTTGDVEMKWEAADTCWRLVVSDTGPGMQDVLGSPVAHELDGLDNRRPDHSTSGARAYHGEGIGLTIVKRLCGLLEAGINMRSDAGVGTTFTIEFPISYDHRDSVVTDAGPSEG